MDDKLDRIFALQKAFQDDLAARRGIEGAAMEQWIQRLSLAMISEISELIDEVNFKWWKRARDVDIGRVRDELADILHFFVSMCLYAGMDAAELFDRYAAKNKINFDRQDGVAGDGAYGSD